MATATQPKRGTAKAAGISPREFENHKKQSREGRVATYRSLVQKLSADGALSAEEFTELEAAAATLGITATEWQRDADLLRKLRQLEPIADAARAKQQELHKRQLWLGGTRRQEVEHIQLEWKRQCLSIQGEMDEGARLIKQAADEKSELFRLFLDPENCVGDTAFRKLEEERNQRHEIAMRDRMIHARGNGYHY